MTTPAQLPRITGPTDLLAAVPYVLGFHPTDSLVTLGLLGDELTFAVRVDLPPAGERPDELIRHLADVVARQRLRAAVLVGYGAEERTRPPLLALWRAIAVPVHDVLRVAEGRFWSYACDDVLCCGPSGRAFDPSSSPVAAAAAYAGVVALPDRETLVARLTPVDGTPRAAMRAATLVAERRLDGLGGSAPAIRSAGRVAVREAIDRQRAGRPHADEEVAWLTVLLRTLAVRDFAWQSITEPELHIDLWTDVVRRAEPALVAPPASLLAFAAWRNGEGALATVAVARAIEADRSYSMALLLEEVFYHGISPSSVDGWPVGPGAARDSGVGPDAGCGAGLDACGCGCDSASGHGCLLAGLPPDARPGPALPFDPTADGRRMRRGRGRGRGRVGRSLPPPHAISA
jgi:hypothetical protein